MVATAHLLGVALGLGAAFSAACNRLFIRSGTQERTAHDAFYVVATVSVLVIVPAVLWLYYPDYGLTPVSWVSFIVAGLLGTLFGNLWLYQSIERIGASRTQPVIASNALVATVLAYLFLGESLTPLHGLGVAFIVAGVAGLAWETTRHSGPGAVSAPLAAFLLPVAAAVAFGTEPILANFGFAEGTPAPVGLAIKLGAAWVGFTGYFLWKGDLPPLTQIVEADGKWFVLAGLAYVGFMLGYYVGLVVAPVNVVTPMIVTNTMFVIVLSAIFMPRRLERVTWRLAAAAGLVVVGAGVITVLG